MITVEHAEKRTSASARAMFMCFTIKNMIMPLNTPPNARTGPQSPEPAPVPLDDWSIALHTLSLLHMLDNPLTTPHATPRMTRRAAQGRHTHRRPRKMAEIRAGAPQPPNMVVLGFDLLLNTAPTPLTAQGRKSTRMIPPVAHAVAGRGIYVAGGVIAPLLPPYALHGLPCTIRPEALAGLASVRLSHVFDKYEPHGLHSFHILPAPDETPLGWLPDEIMAQLIDPGYPEARLKFYPVGPASESTSSAGNTVAATA